MRKTCVWRPGTVAAPAKTVTRSLHERLVIDHEELDLILDRLLAAYRCGDREDAARAFTELAVRLAPHLELEERALFPELPPAETAALRAEHDAIRARIGELGELHHLPSMEELARALRRHAARECARAAHSAAGAR